MAETLTALLLSVGMTVIEFFRLAPVISVATWITTCVPWFISGLVALMPFILTPVPGRREKLVILT